MYAHGGLAGPSSRPTPPPMAFQRRQATGPTSSTSTTPSHTTSHTSASASPTYINPNTIAIPTGTVVGIGLGFVGFAMMVLMVLMAFRMNRVRRTARNMRRRGDQSATFRAVWRAEGGVWGFMGGMAESGGIGGGGWSSGHMLRIRRLEEHWRRERDRAKILDRQRPEWWEVDMKPRPQEEPQDHMDLSTVKPLGVIEARFPEFEKIEPELLEPPSIALSLFVLMPREGMYNHALSREEDELPDVLIGTTELIPMIHPAGMLEGSSSDLDLKASISHVEGHTASTPVLLQSGTDGMRRALWVEAAGGIRHVEGLPPARAEGT